MPDREPHQDSAIFGVIAGALEELRETSHLATDKQIREVTQDLLNTYGVLLDEFIAR